MFDITQVESSLKKESLKEDILFIDGELCEAVYMKEPISEEFVVVVPDYIKQIEELYKNAHYHDNLGVLDKITNDMVDSWNAAATSPRKISELINDSDFITKSEVDEKIKDFSDDRVILTSPSGIRFLLKVSNDGSLYANRL